MKTFAKISLFTVILVGCSFPTPSFAQDSTEYELLEPLPFISEDGSGAECVTEDGNPCTTANTYIPGIVRLIIALSGALAVIKIIFGGITYMSSDAISGKNQGKQQINDALLGLGLVICSWLILYSLNPRLVEFDFTIDGLKSGSSLDRNLGENSPSPSNPTGGTSSGRPLTLLEIAQDNTLRARLANNAVPITVNNPPCKLGETRGCTNIVGLPEKAISGVISLASSCQTALAPARCEIVITGGAEGGHQTHGPGLPKVDLDDTQTLNKYIMSKGQLILPRTKECSRVGNQWRLNGAIYVFERDHWHVCY